jgi:hypothetical protein
MPWQVLKISSSPSATDWGVRTPARGLIVTDVPFGFQAAAAMIMLLFAPRPCPQHGKSLDLHLRYFCPKKCRPPAFPRDPVKLLQDYGVLSIAGES